MVARKTAAPRKTASPRKTTRPRAAGLPGQPDQSVDVTTPGEITFQGRKMRVRLPEPEQLVVWRRTMERLERANVKSWNAQQVLDALDRVRKIIDTVLLDEVDKDWLDDEMLAGRVGLREMTSIIVDSVASFANRAQRRAAKASTAARRKKAA